MIPAIKIFHRSESDRILETRRLLLEPLTRSHAPRLFDSFQDEVLRFISRPKTLVELEEKYTRFQTHGPNDGSQVWLNWAAKDKDINLYIGWFQATVNCDQTTNLSYVVFPPYWRKGYSTEACREMMDHLIAVYAPQVFVVEMDQRNAASVAMAEKLGFTRCGQAAPDEFHYEMPAKNWGRKS